MKDETRYILMAIVLILLIIAILVLVLNQLGKMMESDCEKQNYEGIIDYFGAGVNCEIFNNVNTDFVNMEEKT